MAFLRRCARLSVDFGLRFLSPLLLSVLSWMIRTGIGMKALRRKGHYPSLADVERLTPSIVPLIALMANTGVGTDECLQNGCLPLPVHFHSPVPDLADLERRQIWNRRSDLAGIDFRGDQQLKLLLKLGQEYGHECDWPMYATEDPLQFFTENPSFSFGCAASLHCLLRHYKPQRVIEIGSGNSSLIISDALLRNKDDAFLDVEYLVVDPYPRPIIEDGLPGLTRLVKERVELLDVQFFTQLTNGDMLFIDSGHVARIGGDVNYLFLDVLPRLNSGVVVHIHDIDLPYEYPGVYATNPRFRQFWTEAYLLQAFLCQNDQFEILLALRWLMTDHKKAFQDAFRMYNPSTHRAISSSFWIRCK